MVLETILSDEIQEQIRQEVLPAQGFVPESVHAHAELRGEKEPAVSVQYSTQE